MIKAIFYALTYNVLNEVDSKSQKSLTLLIILEDETGLLSSFRLFKEISWIISLCTQTQ